MSQAVADKLDALALQVSDLTAKCEVEMKAAADAKAMAEMALADVTAAKADADAARAEIAKRDEALAAVNASVEQMKASADELSQKLADAEKRLSDPGYKAAAASGHKGTVPDEAHVADGKEDDKAWQARFDACKNPIEKNRMYKERSAAIGL